MGDWTRNFSRSEFACKCCKQGAEEVHADVVQICQAIRDVVERPVHVTSGYRCQRHNRDVGGVDGSYHTRGMAADLYSDIGAAALYMTVRALYQCETLPALRYCLWYKKRDIVHVDIGKQRKNVFEVAP